jgi:hypothetical protein
LDRHRSRTSRRLARGDCWPLTLLGTEQLLLVLAGVQVIVVQQVRLEVEYSLIFVATEFNDRLSQRVGLVLQAEQDLNSKLNLGLRLLRPVSHWIGTLQSESLGGLPLIEPQAGRVEG